MKANYDKIAEKYKEGEKINPYKLYLNYFYFFLNKYKAG